MQDIEPSSISLLHPEEVSGALKLPPRLQARIKSRIRLVALLCITAHLVILAFVIVNELSDDPSPHTGLRLVALGISLSVSVWTFLTVRRLATLQAVILGLTLEVIACLFVSVATPVTWFLGSQVLFPVTWVTPIMITFPLLIPTPPRWTLTASLCCAMTVPAGAVVAGLRDRAFPDSLGQVLVFSLVAPVVATVIAYIGSHTVHELGMAAETQRRAGSYIVRRQLGAGGMGVVFEAEHYRLRRPAAVKYIKRERLEARFGSADVARRRFDREAIVLSRLHSPHTVTLYDYDINDDGELFYVMELLEGMDAQKLVQDFGPLPPSRAVHLLVQVCRSLEEAHQAGMVHRDIKPSNLMVCTYGTEFDFVKVLDFGLMVPSAEELAAFDPQEANAVPPLPASAARLTLDNRTPGTPDFMSPEQIQRLPVDGRSDLYALGAVGYWLLTGRYVFDDTDLDLKMKRHLSETPVPPSTLMKQAFPAKLEALILSCLAKAPEDRPQTAESLAQALEASVAPPWTQDDARAWWEPRRTAV